MSADTTRSQSENPQSSKNPLNAFQAPGHRLVLDSTVEIPIIMIVERLEKELGREPTYEERNAGVDRWMKEEREEEERKEKERAAGSKG